MALADLTGIVGNPATRTISGLTGAGALLTDPTSALLHPSGAGLDASQLDPFPDHQAEAAGDTNNSVLNLVTPTANDAVLDFHAAIEAQGHDQGTPGTIHGVTDLGETIGLGKVGQPNLVTDVVNTPGALLDGDTSTVSHVPADATAILDRVGDAATGVGNDVTVGQGVLGIPGAALNGAGASGATGLVNSLGMDANGVIHDIGAGTGTSGLTGGVTNLTQDAGLGHIGGANLLTDVVQAPGHMLAGDVGSLGTLPHDVGTLETDAGNSVAGLGQDIGGLGSGSGLIGQTLSDVTGATHVPAAGLITAETGNATGLIQTVADAAGLPETGSGLAHVADEAGLAQSGDGHTLLTDAAATPGDVLQGGTDHVSHLPGDAGNLVASAGQTVSGTAHDLSSITSGTGLTGTPLGDNPTGGNALGDLVRVGGEGTSGSDHNLIQASAGPAAANGLDVGALNAANPTTGHAADVGVAGVSAGGPQVANASLLGDGLHFGTHPDSPDSLVGALQSNAAPQASASADGNATSHGVIDLAALDVGHVDAIHTGSLDQVTQAHHAGI